MKKTTGRLIALLVFLAILISISFIKNYFNKSYYSQKISQPFSSVQKNDISEITIDRGNSQTYIFRKNNQWYLKKNGDNFKADSELVDNIINTIINLKKDEIISNNKSKHENLGIDKKRVIFKVKDKSYTLYIGNNSFRIDNENEVYTNINFDQNFDSQDYRDLLVNFIHDENSVTELTIEFDGKKLLVQKKNNSWEIANDKATKEKIDFFINDLKTLKSENIVKNDALDKEQLEISLTITVKEKNIEKRIDFFEIDDNSYYLKMTGSDYIYKIASGYVASLKKEEKDFID